jgi:stage V sporulation protein AC
VESKEEALKKEFVKILKKLSPKPKLYMHCLYAFLFGGMFCVIGQFINNTLLLFEVPSELVGTGTSIIMIFIGAILTGFGVYDKIANIAGAGSVVPITGFANSVVAPAMEFKKEGFIFGVAAKMFIIAGPVLVYGIGTSVFIGIIHYILTL